ncbi:MAG: ABC transporter substrate-binding protein [Firmicutes bacterium]|nr:ABC transporter substrate-binding protein [Bacillota bacterium]
MRGFSKKSLLLSLILLSVILVFAACTPADQNPSSSGDEQKEQAQSSDGVRIFTDLSGAEVELPEDIHSVIHLWPASTAMQVFLGAGDTITGTLSGVQKGWGWLCAACPHLLEVEGFTGDATAETLLALNPDVVITPNADTAESLRQAGVPCVCMLGDQESIPALEEFCMKMAELLGGDTIAKAESYCQYLDGLVETVSQATSALTPEERVSLYYNSAQHGDSPLLTCGANYITKTWMDICGVDNVAVDLVEGGDVEIAMEEIVAADPDYILVGGSSQEAALATIQQDAAWQGLRAVQEGHVIANPQGVMKWEKFGPEIAIQIVWFTKQVYPQLLADIDVEQHVRDFYSQWYDFDLSDEEYASMLAGSSGPQK